MFKPLGPAQGGGLWSTRIVCCNRKAWQALEHWHTAGRLAEAMKSRIRFAVQEMATGNSCRLPFAGGLAASPPGPITLA